MLAPGARVTVLEIFATSPPELENMLMDSVAVMVKLLGLLTVVRKSSAWLKSTMSCHLIFLVSNGAGSTVTILVLVPIEPLLSVTVRVTL